MALPNTTIEGGKQHKTTFAKTMIITFMVLVLVLVVSLSDNLRAGFHPSSYTNEPLFPRDAKSILFGGGNNPNNDDPPCATAKPNAYTKSLLALSDESLWQLALDRTTGNYCSVSPVAGACDYYAIGRPSDTTSYNGIPRTANDEGTGCIEDDNIGNCYYRDVAYDLTN